MKINNKKIVGAMALAFVMGGWLFSVYLLYRNDQLTSQVDYRDQLIKRNVESDSLNSLKTKQYADTISKYVSGCEIIIDGKTYTLDYFVKLLNDQYKKNHALSDSIINLQQSLMRLQEKYNFINQYSDSFLIYKTIADLTQRQLGVKYYVTRNNNKYSFKREDLGFDSLYVNKRIRELVAKDLGITYEVTYNPEAKYYTFKRNSSQADSAAYYKRVLSMASEHYGLSYTIDEQPEVVRYTISSPFMDSAAVLMPYFRHLITKDTANKVWNIDISKKAIKEARKIKSN